jgi:hypothetical protein
VAISTEQSRLPTFNTAVDLDPCIKAIQQETGRALPVP